VEKTTALDFASGCSRGGWSSEKIWVLRFEWTLTIQASLSDLEYATNKWFTRSDRFLREIDAVMPWSALVAEFGPFHSKVDGRCRPPTGLQRMLRVYIAQQCFGQSGDGIEDAIYDRQAIRGFIGINLNREAASDATILIKFRRLQEANNLTERIFTAINTLRAAKDSLKKTRRRARDDHRSAFLDEKQSCSARP
jgi:IS5 family transposase